ncbi:MAG: hypothetical protein AB7O73_12275 [Bacteroidia bacterium]
MPNESEITFLCQIGNIIYYALVADNKIDPIEKEAFERELIKVEFDFPFKIGISNEEAHEIIKKQVNHLLSTSQEPQLLLERFNRYYINNYDLFSLNNKNSIWRLINQVCNAKNRKNKSELVFLSRMKQLFEIE